MQTALKTQIADVLNPRIKGATGVWLNAVLGAERRGDLPYEAMTAALGVQHAMETGRLSGKAQAAIESMSAAKFAGLLAEVAANCPTIADAPRYLLAKF